MIQVTIEQEYIYLETQYYYIQNDMLPDDFSTWTIDQQAQYVQNNYDQDDYEAEPMDGGAVLSIHIEENPTW